MMERYMIKEFDSGIKYIVSGEWFQTMNDNIPLREEFFGLYLREVKRG